MSRLALPRGCWLARQSVIRWPEVNERVVSTVFWLMVSSGVMVAIVPGAKRILDEIALGWPGMSLIIVVGVATYLGFGLAVYRSAFVSSFKILRTALTPSSSQTSLVGLLDHHA